MKTVHNFITLLLLSLLPYLALAAQDGNSRCKCVCTVEVKPSNETKRIVSVKTDIQAEMCKCNQMDIPGVPSNCDFICECAYENRNTTFIQVVVIGVITLISGLFVYMLFLLCLDPLINRRARGGRNRLVEQDDGVHMEHFSQPVTPTTPNTLASVTSGGDAMRQPATGEYLVDDEGTALSDTPPSRLRLDSGSGARTPQQGSAPNSAPGAAGDDESRGRSTSVLSRLRQPHERWQGQLQNQRHNVYSNRSVLN